ncbi:glycerate kinase [Paenarthrobacter histidinolovorans]|uniref:Glycerate kinase n=1 Tax=Paenarthrobacter histidinolovorans TaxID=43664 RepID=A0ABW8N786_9MICC
MRVVIASDKFKHSLASDEVALHLRKGLQDQRPDLEVDFLPIADGGEGTVNAAVHAGFSPHPVTVTGPTGQPVEATLAVRGHEAIVEVASASGLGCLPGGIPDPLGATSLGTGEMIRQALNLGCTHVYVGAGGSACTDGGAGLLVGLGAKLLNRRGYPLVPGGAALAELGSIDLSELDWRVGKTRFTLASDVNNPLLGERGAAAVFAPQKGANANEIKILEAGLTRLVEALGYQLGERAAEVAVRPGAGAAGGIGFAVMAVLNAGIERGVDVIGRMTGMAGRIAGATLVLTGEGSLDEQSLSGKAPMGVSEAAAAAGIPVAAVCGRTTLSARTLTEAGFARTFALADIEPDVGRCMSNAGALLEGIGRTIAAEMLPVPATSDVA